MKHSFFKQLSLEIIGCVLIAAGIYNFAVQADFPMTGFSGIAIILNKVAAIPIGLSTIILNIPVALLCYKLLGHSFFISSMRCMLFSSVFIDYLAPLFPVYHGDRLLAALCTGIIAGIGFAIIYMQNSSTGGMDFITMSIKSLRPHVSLGKITFLVDIGIILIGGVIFQDIDGIIYGMIVSFLFAVVIDKMMYGINAGKMAFIVTENGPKISAIIDECCQRGTTLLKAQGGYRGDNKQVVMCACNNKEMYLVQRAVKEADPSSFMIILESNEVHGNGFRMLTIGETEHSAKK